MIDFGTAITYDCFKVVQEIYSCNFYDCLRIINQDFGLLLDTKHPRQRKKKIVVNPVETLNQTDPTHKLDCIVKDWDEETLLYWSEYSITQATLDKFKVKPISHIIKNNVVEELNENAYAYCEHLPYLKILRPEVVSKKDKWRSTTPKNIFHGDTYLDSYKGLKFIVTKSLKDVMVLSEMGINAIAVMSESISASELPHDYWKETSLVIMDNDEAGKKCAKTWEKSGFCTAFIEEDGCKDISDLVKKKGLQYAKEYVVKLVLSKHEPIPKE